MIKITATSDKPEDILNAEKLQKIVDSSPVYKHVGEICLKLHKELFQLYILYGIEAEIRIKEKDDHDHTN